MARYFFLLRLAGLRDTEGEELPDVHAVRRLGARRAKTTEEQCSWNGDGDGDRRSVPRHSLAAK